jgi:hypothetical protein
MQCDSDASNRSNVANSRTGFRDGPRKPTLQGVVFKQFDFRFAPPHLQSAGRVAQIAPSKDPPADSFDDDAVVLLALAVTQIGLQNLGVNLEKG